MIKLIRFYSTIALLSLSTILKAQPKAIFDKLALFPIKNVNWRLDNSQNIDPIKSLFKKYNVIVLAESQHMDGTTIDAQCMFIKELIDAGIINTLYLESSTLNAQIIMKILREEGVNGISKAKKYAESGDYLFWIESGFWEYLANKIIEKKIDLVGVDIETTSPALVKDMIDETRYLPSVDKLFKKDSIAFYKIRNIFWFFIDFQQKLIYPLDKFKIDTSFIANVITDYNAVNNTLKVRQWRIMAKYLYWIYQRQFKVKEKVFNDIFKNPLGVTKFYSIRDSIMAEIFLEDYTKRKNVKAILSMSAYHSMKNMESSKILWQDFVGEKTHIMNDILNKTLPNQIYNVCFVAASGEWGSRFADGESEVVKIKAPKKSLEKYFENKENDLFFTDLQGSAINEEEFCMQVVYKKPIVAKWAKIFSGLFFIRKMYPLFYNRPMIYK
jgi:erythromycin esterase-like protein